MFKTIGRIVTTAVALVISASASTVIFDNQSSHQGGTLTFGTVGGVVTLTNGVIDQVTHIDGLVSAFAVTGNCGTALTYGCLSFTTGSFIDSTTAGDTTTYRYDAGGSLTVTGFADSASGVLFSNAGFASPVTLNYNSLTGLASLSGTIVAGQINPTLAASLGVVPTTIGGTETSSSFSVVFSGLNGVGTATTNSVQLGANQSTVPEPQTLVLVGAGLIAISFSRRARM